MEHRKILMGTNWKMHKTRAEAAAYTKELAYLLRDFGRFQFFVIPPFTDLETVGKLVAGSNILLGAQNMHWEDEGAYTGEISPVMLKEFGIDVVEIGHSERRQYFGETDYTVNKKVLAALSHGLIPLICIGEQAIEKDFNVSQEVLARQLKIALHGVSKQQIAQVWIAYEPVWAIGEQGVPAAPSYAGKMHTVIRGVLHKLYPEDVAAVVPLLYGGSVNHLNAVDLFNQPDVDGLFVGRAAWQPDSFRRIVDLLVGELDKN